MFGSPAIRIGLLSLALGFSAMAEPAILNYQGRVTHNGTNLNGNAYFVFSIHDTNGMILWSSGDFPVAGSTNLPAGVWRLGLRDGIYNIRLGDRGAGMPALDGTALKTAATPYLRVWFNEGSAWRQLPEDAPLRGALRPMVVANNPAPAPETVLTSSQGDAILRELRELRGLVQKQQAPQPAPAPAPPQIATVGVAGSPSLGNDDAPIVLVEFTDYQCPFCKRAHDDATSTLQKKYVDTGKLRFVSRNLPLSFHANAEPAAHAALCAMQQKQFWAMRDRLFAINTALYPSNFLQAAGELNLDTNLFVSCVNGQAFATQIAKDKQDAESAGITGTPTFVLGKLKDGKVTGSLIVGARPAAFFEAEIEKLIAAK
jgi:protein-disulfide isomerase